MKDILPELNGKSYFPQLYLEYDIHFCREDEYADLVAFLRDHWRADHIFTCSKELLDFQHLCKEKHQYNFVLARCRASGEIHSILGFVPTSQYDNSVKKTVIWPCIWKARSDVKKKGLGIILYHYLKTALEIDAIAILGISEVALSIYKSWNFQTGKIRQYVMPNHTVTPSLAVGLEQYPDSVPKDGDKLQLVRYSKQRYMAIPEENRLFDRSRDHKAKPYYIHRFLEHPIYTYQMYAAEDEEGPRAILITRECGNGESVCLRIVDYIGEFEALPGVAAQIKELLMRNRYEYIDFSEVGVPDELLHSAGFIERDEYPGSVVPNYFEPFLRQNIYLDYAHKSVADDDPIVFFKADADQDRPNHLPQ